MHSIIEKYLTGVLEKCELDKYYLSEFYDNVKGKAPNISIFKNYFQQGLEYVKNFSFPFSDIVGVEKKVLFDIGDKKFVGVIDAVAKDENGLIVIDNKSRNLKPRNPKKKITKSEIELNKYLRQLYIYSKAITQEYNQTPQKLCFNCFRNKSTIVEPFEFEAFEESQKWALEMIETIRNTEEWTPKLDYFVCNHLCDVCSHCEYKQLL